MDISNLGLLVLIITGVMFLRSFLVDTKKNSDTKMVRFFNGFYNGFVDNLCCL